jgi:hypothetical protein
MASKLLGFIAGIALSLILSFSGNIQAGTHKNKDFHAIHMMMNHGLNMILDGSSLIMMTEMDIDITFAKDPLVHGNAMIANGKELIDRAIRGPVMVEMHVKKKGDATIMDSTHQLGELMLKTAYSQGIMQPVEENSIIAKHLHVLHLEANHALMMACQGSNMVMIGQADRTNDLQSYSFEQGHKMMLNARTILLDLLNSAALKDMESRILNPEDKALLKYTKKHLINSLDIANILIRMEFD